MAMPPKNVPASELWLNLAERPRPTRPVEFPTRSGAVGKTTLWILTEEELHACRKGARAVAKALIDDGAPGDTAFEDIYRNELIVQLLCRACRAPENVSIGTFPNPDAARKILLTDEWAVLFDAYQTFRVESGPMLSEMTAAEMHAWLKVLQEGGSALPLARMTSEGLQQLALHFAQLLASSSTDSGSSGSPPDASSPPPSAEPEPAPS